MHHQELKFRCRLLLGSQADAEDAYSRAAVLALERYSRYANVIRNPRAWLLRLVINTCITMMRERRRGILLLGDMDSGPAAEARSSLREAPEEQYAQKQVQRELRRMLRVHIRGLPRRLRQPVVLRLVMDKEYHVIAERLGITQANARKRVQHGREELMRVLQDSLQALLGEKAVLP